MRDPGSALRSASPCALSWGGRRRRRTGDALEPCRLRSQENARRLAGPARSGSSREGSRRRPSGTRPPTAARAFSGVATAAHGRCLRLSTTVRGGASLGYTSSVQTVAPGIGAIDLNFWDTPRAIATGVYPSGAGVALGDPGPVRASRRCARIWRGRGFRFAMSGRCSSPTSTWITPASRASSSGKTTAACAPLLAMVDPELESACRCGTGPDSPTVGADWTYRLIDSHNVNLIPMC